MVRLITTRDVGPWAFDEVIGSWTDDEWLAAVTRRDALRRKYGPFFKLLDH